MVKVVITFGTFDLFHEGHLYLLERAKSLGDKLVVGVSSDSFNFVKKQRYPVISEISRMKIVGALSCVDDVFLEESMELKQFYIKKYNASILAMGDDWKGSFEMDECDSVYFPRTEETSTTEIIEKIRGMKNEKK